MALTRKFCCCCCKDDEGTNGTGHPHLDSLTTTCPWAQDPRFSVSIGRPVLSHALVICISGPVSFCNKWASWVGPGLIHYVSLVENHRTANTTCNHPSLSLLLWDCTPSVRPLPMPRSLLAPSSPSLTGNSCFFASGKLESLYDFSTFPVTVDALPLSLKTFFFS